MFNDAKAANMAAYLLCRAGADGLSRRRLLALMYLAERDLIKRRGVPAACDAFMLTEYGPVMKHTYARIMGGLDRAPGAHREWDRIAPAREPAMVADTGAAYAERPPAASAAERLALRSPQPPIRWVHSGVLRDPQPDEWDGQDEGIPYFGMLAPANRHDLDETWRIHGDRDEDDLIQHMLELPERGDAISGDLPLSAILKAVGYTPREIKEILAEAYAEGFTDSPHA